jgi:hypothetical protein
MYYRKFSFQTSYPSISLETRQVSIRLDYEAETQMGCPVNINHTINRGENSDHKRMRIIVDVHNEPQETVMEAKIIGAINFFH